ncbi:MAG: hypothetical protein E7677_00765 [Ruminococcaceae bacterium]|nr:hypothetical protein [Oscillospiraceae bacterium]
MNKASTVIDFHAHILPKLDHGCRSIEECGKQMEIISSSKTDIAVATPHFYPHVHRLEDFITRREEAISNIKSSDLADIPKLCVGAEVLLCKNLSKMDGLTELCIKGTNIILLELPMRPLKSGHLEAAEDMMSDGFTIMLAHVDRYLRICPNDLDALQEMGALMQLNADAVNMFSLHGRLKRYIKEGSVCAIGSDLHGANPTDYKKFVKAPAILKNHYIDIMNSSQKLLENAIMI